MKYLILMLCLLVCPVTVYASDMYPDIPSGYEDYNYFVTVGEEHTYLYFVEPDWYEYASLGGFNRMYFYDSSFTRIWTVKYYYFTLSDGSWVYTSTVNDDVIRLTGTLTYNNQPTYTTIDAVQYEARPMPTEDNPDPGGLIDLSGILRWLKNIANGIASLASSIVDGIVEALKSLFIPSDGYFDTKVQATKEELNRVFPYQDYIDAVQSSGNTRMMRSSGLQDIEVDFGNGISGQLINFKYIRENLDFIHMVIRGLFYVPMILYHLNQMYFLIRGTRLIGGEKD